LLRKLQQLTCAAVDQDHIPVLLLSIPNEITDRSAFLLGKVKENPNRVILSRLDMLRTLGVSKLAIPCNTFHAPAIMDEIENACAHCGIRLIHIVREAVKFVMEHLPDVRKVGYLSTVGTCKAGVYERELKQAGFEAVRLSADLADQVHSSIYNEEWGLKARPSGNCEVMEILSRAIKYYEKRNVGAIIIACTELALICPQISAASVPLVDANAILAKALLTCYDPGKLRSDYLSILIPNYRENGHAQGMANMFLRKSYGLSGVHERRK
jgi:aspartate racemase